MIDRTCTACERCTKGHYTEMSLYDDLGGTLTCNLCLHKISRYSDDSESQYSEADAIVDRLKFATLDDQLDDILSKLIQEEINSEILDFYWLNKNSTSK